MRLIDFEPSHLEYVMLRKEQKEFLEIMSMDGYGEKIALPGLSYSLITQEFKFVGCGGLMPMGTGKAHAWLYISEDIKKYKFTAFKIIRDNLIKFQEEQNIFWRIQAVVVSDWAVGNAFARRLGFECEGRMKAYGEYQEDHNLYARVPEKCLGWK